MGVIKPEGHPGAVRVRFSLARRLLAPPPSQSCLHKMSMVVLLLSVMRESLTTAQADIEDARSSGASEACLRELGRAHHHCVEDAADAVLASASKDIL